MKNYEARVQKCKLYNKNNKQYTLKLIMIEKNFYLKLANSKLTSDGPKFTFAN